MSLSSDDRQQLQLSAEKFFAQHHGWDARRARLRAGNSNDRAIWQAMADSGWLGLLVPAESDGLGGSPGDLAVVLEAYGSCLATEPLVGIAALSAPLVAELGGKTYRPLLDALVAGSTQAVLAHAEPEHGFVRGPLTTKADAQNRITGRKHAVLDAPSADLFLVSAKDAAGQVGLFAVERSAPGVQLTSYGTVDDRQAANIDFAGAPATRLGTGDASAVLDRALDAGLLAQGDEAAGAMSKLIDMTAAYLQQRKQFGRALATFQVLQHRMVDMFVALEESRALLAAAREALDGAPKDRTLAVAAAMTATTRAAKYVAQQGVQLHGGMGMTDELPVSHYFRRLTMLSTYLGDADGHLDRYRTASWAA
jgi:alkylation response protein AidB-like acyl-CoA dehydrogenase